MNKINILGINIKDYTLKEALKNSEGYMKNGACNTIAYISSRQLAAAAGGNEMQREWIESVDMTICAEADILCAEEGIGRNRIREIEENAFLVEFLKRAVRDRRNVYLLSDTEEHLSMLQTWLQQLQAGLCIAGKAVLPEEENIDNFINEVNAVAPDIMISQWLPPRQEHLVYEDKKKINAKIWLALLENSMVRTERKTTGSRMKQYFVRKVFRKKVEKYRRGEE